MTTTTTTHSPIVDAGGETLATCPDAAMARWVSDVLAASEALVAALERGGELQVVRAEIGLVHAWRARPGKGGPR